MGVGKVRKSYSRVEDAHKKLENLSCKGEMHLRKQGKKYLLTLTDKQGNEFRGYKETLCGSIVELESNLHKFNK